jgi:hypothetical protein
MLFQEMEGRVNKECRGRRLQLLYCWSLGLPLGFGGPASEKIKIINEGR